MSKTEIRRFIAIMEFFYGFLFGGAIFASLLAFLIAPDVPSGLFFGVCIFSIFMFLCMLSRYCIIRIKLSLINMESKKEDKEKI